MKIELTPHGMGSRVFDREGNEITGITDISVHASINHPTKAEITLGYIETTTAK